MRESKNQGGRAAASVTRPLLSIAVLTVFSAACFSVACGSTGSGGAAAPDVTEPSTDVRTAVDCGQLDELACVTSAECTLNQAEDKSYFCAAPASACEEGFVQRSANAEACGAGCTFIPAQCYCSPDVTCICGGGPPAQCVASS